MNYLVVLLYLVSFGMFIYGLMGLTGPRTAVRGNWIAAAGMALAVIATLVYIRHTENWGLIIAGLLLGVVLGVPPARLTKGSSVSAAVRSRQWKPTWRWLAPGRTPKCSSC